MAYFDRLTALDASFLDIEDENTHMHVAVALLFEPGALARPGGGVDAERIREFVASRLHQIPRYRQRLAFVPVEQHPVWVDDASFNIVYHVRHTALPRPGDERQLKRLCGRILSQKLDHTKPLWEMWVIEGLADGRFALIAKAHHCMVDGVSGVDLLTALLSPSPDADFAPAPPWTPRPVPSGAELVASETRRRARLSFDLVRQATAALAQPLQAASEALEQAAGLFGTALEALTPASETPLNPPAIGPHRRFDWVRFDLAAVKAIRAAAGGTLNDVVLATVVGALRRYLLRRGLDVSGLDFRALIPVSVRRASEHGTLGNKVAQMLAHLPIDEADPRRRLERVSVTTAGLKHSHQIEATELLEEIGDLTATAVVTSSMRLAASRRTYNVIVTNVPGPQMPLYMIGAPLVATYPMVPLFSNQALGIALFSYAGSLFWGVNADWDAVADLHDVVGDLEAGFAELCEATGVARSSRDPRPADANPGTAAQAAAAGAGVRPRRASRPRPRSASPLH